MIFSPRELSTIITMCLRPKFISHSSWPRENSSIKLWFLYSSHVHPDWGMAHGCPHWGYIPSLKINGHVAFLTESTRQTCFLCYNERIQSFSTLVRKRLKGRPNLRKTKKSRLGPRLWGTVLFSVLTTTDTRSVFKHPQQIDEINEKHTDTCYRVDMVLDENIKALQELSEALDSVDVLFFVVPTKVTAA